MKRVRYVFRYIVHTLTAYHSGGHGIHSPYVYNFIQNVFNTKHPFYVFDKIEALREHLRVDTRMIHLNDLGTGKSGAKQIGHITKRASSHPVKAQWLFRIIHYCQLHQLLELGTSVGISTLYMASVSKKNQCITLEGCENIASIAQRNFKSMKMDHIMLITGDIGDTLVHTLRQYGRRDFIFIDANHRYESTVEYVKQCLPYISDQTIMVIDDIYWSSEMMKAWKTIKQLPGVMATIDVFYMGIVFFNPMLSSKHYKIRRI